MTAADQRIRVVHVIARLNIGGVAVHVITLARLLEARGYAVRLVRGREDPDEGTMDDLAAELGVSPTLIASMWRDPGPSDFDALWRVGSILRHDRPRIVHTHAAKGGTIGRLAALLALPGRRERPVLVHTFHGHSLTGYFSAARNRVFLEIERQLARRTDALIAVSDEVRDDLVKLGVAPPERFTVIPYGFDLSRFTEDADREPRRARLRAEWGVSDDAEVVTLIARLVPIKRVDRFLRMARRLHDRPRARFVVVGDGELREQLVGSPDAQALGDRVVWAGFRRDMPDVCFASDVVALTSDNEGTPISLIEAQAAGVPVVGTDVGGVRTSINDGQTGFVAGADDDAGLADAVRRLLENPDLGQRFARAGRQHATHAFSVGRLVDDVESLYRSLLSSNRPYS